MTEQLSRSWNLVKASGAVIRADPELMMFPLISSFASIGVMACFTLPLFGLQALDGMLGTEGLGLSLGVLVLAFSPKR